VAAATLEQLGVTREKIRDASHRLFAYPASTTPSQHAVLSAEGQAALAAAEQLAAERTPTCAPVVVNTPQLLAVIALKPGSRARRVLNDIGINTADIKRQLHCYINVPAPASAAAPAASAAPATAPPAAPSAATHAATNASWSPAQTSGSAVTASSCAAKSSPNPRTSVTHAEPDTASFLRLRDDLTVRQVPPFGT
jgi:hypothetical protein